CNDGVVLALDAHTGETVWENHDFGGAVGDSCLGEDGTLYITGMWGPDFIAIDRNGKTLAYIGQFDKRYFWPDTVKLIGDDAVEVMMTMKDEWDNIGEFPFRVSLSDWSYALVKPERTEAEKKWREAYRVYILSQEEYAGYQLLDIGYDVPLLYLQGEYTAQGDMLCIYDAKTGRVNTQYAWVDGVEFIEGKNLLLDSGGNMDVYYDKVYTVRDGQFVCLHTGEYGAANNVTPDPDNYLYNWDEKMVSEQEYQSLLSEAFNEHEARFARDFTIEKKNMLSILEP
ncbi:MAG: hypothetical protein ACI4XW_10385, partial [Candidatus Spyradocola sp.]